jgi:Zn-finger nucleic acid-binding protein
MMSDRQGIEIDFCPHCRGVWLDRGELDKIIERTQDMTPGARPQGMQPSSSPACRDDDRSRERHDGDRRDGHYKMKGGFLAEIFDFD